MARGQIPLLFPLSSFHYSGGLFPLLRYHVISLSQSDCLIQLRSRKRLQDELKEAARIVATKTDKFLTFDSISTSDNESDVLKSMRCVIDKRD